MLSKFYTLLFITCFLIISCIDSGSKNQLNTVQSTQTIPETNHPDFVSNMEIAHNKSRLLKNGVICFNLDMTFGGRKSLMKIFTTPTSSAIRVDKKDGASTVMVNSEIFTDADSSRWNSEKFGVYTYQYFFMSPFKFSDKGTIWTRLPDMEIDSQNTNRAMLTFESGTGDAPNDWYIVHSDPETNRVKYIGYIVTGGGTSVEEAEKNAHAIKYSDYKIVDGIPFAKKWEFFDYSKDGGLGEKIGEGIIKNVEMMDVVDQFEIINDGTYVKISDL